MRLLFWPQIRIAPSGDQGGQACNQSLAFPHRHLRPVLIQQLVEKSPNTLSPNKLVVLDRQARSFLCTSGHDVHKLRYGQMGASEIWRHFRLCRSFWKGCLRC